MLDARRPLDVERLGDGVHVVGEGVTGAAAVGPRDDGYVQVGQLDAGIGLGDGVVVPVGDLSQEDADVGFAGEADRLGDAGQVVGEDDDAGGHRQKVDAVRIGVLSLNVAISPFDMPASLAPKRT